jgi:hypothetical protein
MSLIPGYNFTINEQVTAEKLLKWMLGIYVDPTSTESAQSAGLSVVDVSTGSTCVTLSSEGDLFYNESTGFLEIQTARGAVPFLAGSRMFTSKFQRGYSSSPANDDAYFWEACTLSCLNNTTRVTITDINNLTDGRWWENIPTTTWRYNTGQGAFGYASAPHPLWPTLENAEQARTEATLTQDRYRLLCMRGWSPVIGTANSAYTGALQLMNYYLTMSPISGELAQPARHIRGYMRAPAVWNATTTKWGAAGNFFPLYAYFEPCVPGYSASSAAWQRATTV